MESFYPFQEGDRYTEFDNYILDVMMPDLPPTAWKILTFIIRKTRGWVDRETGQRKRTDKISYKQIMEGTGIKSAATISKGVKVLLAKQYIVAHGSGEWEATEYGLNLGYSVSCATSKNESASKNEAASTSKNEVVPTSKNEDTKERVKKERKTTVAQNDMRRQPPAKQAEPIHLQQAPVNRGKRRTKSPPQEQVTLFEPQQVEPRTGNEPGPVPERTRKPDPLWDAIAEAWGCPSGLTAKIKQQLLGKIPTGKSHHLCNFDKPATPDEVRAFAEWYKRTCEGCPMPMAPEKIQHHFYAFRRDQEEAARRSAPRTRVAYGRLLRYDAVSRNWYDIGPAPSNTLEAYAS